MAGTGGRPRSRPLRFLSRARQVLLLAGVAAAAQTNTTVTVTVWWSGEHIEVALISLFFLGILLCGVAMIATTQSPTAFEDPKSQALIHKEH